MIAVSRRRLAAVLAAALCFASSAHAAGAAAANESAVVVDEPTEVVIKAALRYLQSKQEVNGSWNEPSQNHPIAITGYALMAFMTAGNLPNEGEYGKTVATGLQYLLDAIQADGLYRPASDGQYMYGHGIATIALAELYGQSKSPMIRAKLERVVKLIIACQNDQGGWRYHPYARDADISVTVLQVVALRAAKNAGLDVPQATMDRAVNFVHRCYNPGSGGFGYQPGSGPGFARTAAAIYSLQVCGQYDDPAVKTGSEYLFKHKDDHEWFTYGNFYAAPAQYMVGGETWKNWYGLMRDLMLKNVDRQGPLAHWEPSLDRNNGVGPVYATAVYTMVLAMPYHYVPLYQR